MVPIVGKMLSGKRRSFTEQLTAGAACTRAAASERGVRGVSAGEARGTSRGRAPTCVALGLGDEGYASFAIGSPTGEGLTTATSVSREQRCTLKGYLRIV